MKKPLLTAIIITKDKSRISRTKKSLDFADEIIIEEHPQISNFALVRNQAMQKAQGEWVLFIDDDEEVSPDLQKEILTHIQSNPKVNGFFLKRKDFFLGRLLNHGENGNLKFLRLARKSAGTFYRPIHEVWLVKGHTRTLRNPLFHRPHPSLKEFIAKINTYSTMDAQYRYQLKKKSTLFHIFIFPLAKFIHNYIIRLGFLDGIPGFIMAGMMSFHSFQTWTKLYLLQHKQ